MSSTGGPGAQTPAVSIDEALELFLLVSFPQGLPEGVDREELLQRLRAQVAADRPEWAAASEASAPPPADPPAPPPAAAAPGAYAALKDEIVRKAQLPDIPSDPEERYFHERAEEARRNREQRAEERLEAEAKQALIKELIARRSGHSASGPGQPLLLPGHRVGTAGPQSLLGVQPPALARAPSEALRIAAPAPHVAGLSTGEPEGPAPPTISGERDLDSRTLEEARRIRELLLERVKAVQVDGAEALRSQAAASAAALSVEAQPATRPAPPSRPEIGEALRSLTPDEQKRVVQSFAEARRALLKKREDLLAERRPRIGQRRGEPLALSGSSDPRAVRSGGLSFEEPRGPRPSRSRFRIE